MRVIKFQYLPGNMPVEPGQPQSPSSGNTLSVIETGLSAPAWRAFTLVSQRADPPTGVTDGMIGSAGTICQDI